MIPKFRAWLKERKEIKNVTSINFDETYTFGGYLPPHVIVEERCDIFTFDEIELMQSTGLKDKNGVEIFEGDVVNYFTKSNSVIEWKDSGFIIKRVIDGAYELMQNRIAEIEVIGNIYQNPELLEESAI